MVVGSTRPLRVANIIEEGKLGGPQMRIVAVAAAMKGRVETIVIMPSENSARFRSRCEVEGVNYVTFPISRITKEWRVVLRYLFFSIFEIIQVTRFLKEKQFDLVHVSGGSWQYKGVIAGKLAGIKVLWHLNDTSIPSAFRQMFGVLSSLASGYICSSHRTYVYYNKYMKRGRLVDVIHPPVDVKKYSPIGVRAVGGNTKDIVIGTVCNISPIKNIDIIVDSLCLLNIDKSITKSFIVEVAGSVSSNQRKYYNILLKKIENCSVGNIKFLGTVDNVKSFLDRIDIYVCSSLAESGPMTLFEAMAMEKAIVSTDVGDVSKLIQDGVSGYVIGINDSQALADRISKYISDDRLRQRHGVEARKVTVQKLDVSYCADRHVKAYMAQFNGMDIKPSPHIS